MIWSRSILFFSPHLNLVGGKFGDRSAVALDLLEEVQGAVAVAGDVSDSFISIAVSPISRSRRRGSFSRQQRSKVRIFVGVSCGKEQHFNCIVYPFPELIVIAYAPGEVFGLQHVAVSAAFGVCIEYREQQVKTLKTYQAIFDNITMLSDKISESILLVVI